MAITILLIIINVAIFYFFNMQLSDVDLFEFFTVYGLNQYTVSNPLNWLTSMFLHGGTAHIAMNMIVLYQCGAILESSMNKMTYLLLYLICGISGSFAAVVFSRGWYFPCSCLLFSSTNCLVCSLRRCNYGTYFGITFRLKQSRKTQNGVIKKKW